MKSYNYKYYIAFMKSHSKILNRQKKKDQSQFRVHFSLMNVYCSDNNYQKFLNMITQQISVYIKADIVQISNIVDDNHVDLSVGVQNDKQAIRFLIKKITIALPYQNYMKQYEPRTSTVFQTFIDRNKSLISQKSSNSSSLSSSDQNSSFDHRQDKSDAYSDKYRSNKSKQHKKIQNGNKIFYSLWLFGIPLQFSQKQVDYKLKQYRVFFRACRWKMIQDMEYLQIELQNPINFQSIQLLDLKVGKYPIVVIPKLKSEQYIYDQIKRFQCEIISKDYIDQSIIMKSAYKCGGVLSIIKQVFSVQQSYILVFNNTNKILKFRKWIEQSMKNCIIKTPSKPIRIGRYQKYFSCEHLFAQNYETQNSFVKY